MRSAALGHVVALALVCSGGCAPAEDSEETLIATRRADFEHANEACASYFGTGEFRKHANDSLSRYAAAISAAWQAATDATGIRLILPNGDRLTARVDEYGRQVVRYQWRDTILDQRRSEPDPSARALGGGLEHIFSLRVTSSTEKVREVDEWGQEFLIPKQIAYLELGGEPVQQFADGTIRKSNVFECSSPGTHIHVEERWYVDALKYPNAPDVVSADYSYQGRSLLVRLSRDTQGYAVHALGENAIWDGRTTSVERFFRGVHRPKLTAAEALVAVPFPEPSTP